MKQPQNLQMFERFFSFTYLWFSSSSFFDFWHVCFFIYLVFITNLPKHQGKYQLMIPVEVEEVSLTTFTTSFFYRQRICLQHYNTRYLGHQSSGPLQGLSNSDFVWFPEQNHSCFISLFSVKQCQKYLYTLQGVNFTSLVYD